MKHTSLTTHTRAFALGAIICSVVILLSTHPTFADASSYFDTSGIFSSDSGLSTSSPTDLALNILGVFLGLIGLIDVCVIIYAGFTILISQGNPEKVKSGRDTLVWAIVGSLIIFSSLGIVIYLGNVIGA